MHVCHNPKGLTSTLVACILTAITSGCQLVPQRTVWNDALVARPRLVARPLLAETGDEYKFVRAQEAYADAAALERQGESGCVDLYYAAAAQTWQFAVTQPDTRLLQRAQARDMHQSALVKTITTAQRFGRWHAYTGLTVHSTDQPLRVPVQYRGFVWQPHEFHELVPVGDYDSTSLSNAYVDDGAGAPMVVVRHRPAGQLFVPNRSAFAATVVMKPLTQSPISDFTGASPLEIEISDPLRTSSTYVGVESVTLAKDLTAPIAFQLGTTQRTWWGDFVRPGTPTGNLGLYMVEPYQPGKIPVVFVHGLLSDPFTWANMLNELRTVPDIADRFQFWAFEYPTGEPFVNSAARLRTDLEMLRQTIDPGRTDAALSQTVLVGHSMGGLVAKLQVTHSGDMLWRSVANRPLAVVRANDATRARLARSFYFGPSPDVRRVVFIGTPHRGSVDSQRLTAQLLASLVEESPDIVAMHQQLIQDNPGVFSKELTDRVPTSIDMLEPESYLLQAMLQLPINPQSQLHSIIGNARWSVASGAGDGVVPVSSAEHPGVVSERLVPAVHTRLTGDPEVIVEVVAILRAHSATN